MRDLVARLGYRVTALVPHLLVQKKNSSFRAQNRPRTFPHVKTEFKYGSGMVELGLGGFLEPPIAFLGDFIFQ